jgi:hypothetical protein
MPIAGSKGWAKSTPLLLPAWWQSAQPAKIGATSFLKVTTLGGTDCGVSFELPQAARPSSPASPMATRAPRNMAIRYPRPPALSSGGSRHSPRRR